MRNTMSTLAKYLVLVTLVAATATGCATNPQPQPQSEPQSSEEAVDQTAEPVAQQETGTPAATQPVAQNLVPIGQGANRENFEQLLLGLVTSYEAPSPESTQEIENTLVAIQATAETDFAVAQSIANNWQSVFANPDYQLAMYGGGDLAPELAQSGISDVPTHAFVVMGYELVDGEMSEELRARCDAAAAAARSYPSTIIVCSGGATGLNNAEGHTEAGMMKDYLTGVCGIDPTRVHVDETSQDTAQNAQNTMAILRNQGIQTFTIVTSAYHQAWAQAVYNVAAALSMRDFGTPIAIVGNYNVDFPLTEVAPGTEDRWAAQQVADVLSLPKEDMQALLW